MAQIVPDATLPTNSTVTVNGNELVVGGGTSAGSNLFHSFQEFSVPTGTEALFNNSTRINRIITRVSGSEISAIDGLIRTNGTADLFLLNPNGIIFGENARLEVGGSFLATTAESILFADDREFSATNTESNVLLNVSIPLGLQFNAPARPVQVRNSGHGLRVAAPLQVEIEGALAVTSGQTLALVGGEISLVGANLQSPRGRLELGAVTTGIVDLFTSTNGWQLNYDRVQTLGEIDLSQQAAVGATGNGSGSLQVVGDRISLSDGSVFWLRNQGEADSGNLRVYARQLLTLDGIDPSLTIPTYILSETAATGRGGDIAIQAGEIRATNGAEIVTRTYGLGRGGDLNIEVEGSVTFDGFAIANPNLISGALTGTFGPANGGDLSIDAERLTLSNGGSATAFTFAAGNSGNTIVRATDIEVVGINTPVLGPSSLGASSFGAGNAGSLSIIARRIRVANSGRISTTTLVTGNAGNVSISATESIEVSDRAAGTLNPSLIDSSANAIDPVTQALLMVPALPEGDAGNVIVRAPSIRIDRGAEITVRNDGTGNGGVLRIEAQRLDLDTGGGITASTVQGQGGNIALNIDGAMILRNGGRISARAGGTGNGGNLTIETDVLAALQNSDIIANAFAGNGGNIDIESRAVVGTAFRPMLTPQSDITASSELGIDGVVSISNPEVNSTYGIVELDNDPIDKSDRIVTGCNSPAANQFVVTGRGGLPDNPNRLLRGQTVWSDLRSLENDSLEN